MKFVLVLSVVETKHLHRLMVSGDERVVVAHVRWHQSSQGLHRARATV
jgi:hypothetical protein